MSEIERLIKAMELIHRVSGDMLDPVRRQGPTAPQRTFTKPKDILGYNSRDHTQGIKEVREKKEQEKGQRCFDFLRWHDEN
jgi:hypothetical protein